jgi:UrcA family protein
MPEAYLLRSPQTHEDVSMTISPKLISIVAVAAASLVSFSSGAAELADDTAHSRDVKMWDLDLAKAEDVQTLYERVREAANDVCRAEARRHWATTRRPVPFGWSERCVDDAIESAVREVGNRRLATLHSSETRVLL